MRLRLEQLEQHLSTQLLPVYLVSGDEPLQVMETMDILRAKARGEEYLTRELMDVSRDFNWSSLTQAAASMSLFGDKRILECRLSTGKPGKEGGAAFIDYCEMLPQDTVLFIQMGKLDKSSQNTKWFKALEKVGAVVQLWPVGHQQMPGWIKRRAQNNGLSLPHDASTLLAERVEGNLLAAAQEIEKLRLLFSHKMSDGEVFKLSAEDVAKAVSNSARYSVYDLVDAALLGDKKRVVAVLKGLEGEGVAAPLIAWSLCNEARQLLKFRQQVNQGESPEMVFNAVWQNRREMIKNAVRRLSEVRLKELSSKASHVDKVTKGFAKGNIWDELLILALALAGEPDYLKASGN